MIWFTAASTATLVAVPLPAAPSPDGLPIPPALSLAEAVDGPVAPPATITGTDEATTERAVASAASAGLIPAAALAAYQRAATVLASADPECGVGWELIAAIGQVESQHGQHAGSALDAAGVAQPAILGPHLNGRGSTSLIRDTDAGEIDGDHTYDRAVGPMQFIPSTWAVVGVDGDADGVRDPQDIDDASLAAAVYLCSGTEDLTSEPGQRSAVYRYNHSTSYVDLVLAIMAAYQAAAATVPTGVTALAIPALPTIPVPASTGTTPDDPPPGFATRLDDPLIPLPKKPKPSPSPAAEVDDPEIPLPSDSPTDSPPESPTESPSESPSDSPSESPSESPTESPSESPSGSPSDPAPAPEPSPALTPPDVDFATVISDLDAACSAAGVDLTDGTARLACHAERLTPSDDVQATALQLLTECAADGVDRTDAQAAATCLARRWGFGDPTPAAADWLLAVAAKLG